MDNKRNLPLESSNTFYPPVSKMGVSSVSPICGCNSQCAYCYIALKGFNNPNVNTCSLEENIRLLTTSKDFIVGKSGNIILIGTWGEPFPINTYLRKVTLNWIKEFMTLGNPIVITSKNELKDEELLELQENQKYDKQLTILETITTMKYSSKVEPGASLPKNRLLTLSKANNFGLTVAALINPYINKLVKPEIVDVLSAISNSGVENIVISPLYVNDLLLKQINKNKFMYEIIADYNKEGSELIESVTDERIVIKASPIDDYEYLSAIAKSYKINCYKHYLCMLSNIYHQKHTCFYKTEFCCNCGNCYK